MWNLILKAALAYIESHPDVIEQLVDQLVQAGIKALKARNAA